MFLGQIKLFLYGTITKTIIFSLDGPESEDNVSRLNQLPGAENSYLLSKITLKASNTNDNALY